MSTTTHPSAPDHHHHHPYQPNPTTPSHHIIDKQRSSRPWRLQDSRKHATHDNRYFLVSNFPPHFFPINFWIPHFFFIWGGWRRSFFDQHHHHLHCLAHGQKGCLLPYLSISLSRMGWVGNNGHKGGALFLCWRNKGWVLGGGWGEGLVDSGAGLGGVLGWAGRGYRREAFTWAFFFLLFLRIDLFCQFAFLVVVFLSLCC